MAAASNPETQHMKTKLLYLLKLANTFRLVLLLWFIIASCFSMREVQAQEIKFTPLTKQDDLSSSTINVIVKDRYGLLWFAADEGLYKYDGHTLKIYALGPQKTSACQSNGISALYEDKAGRLWVGTAGSGLYLYDRHQDVFSSYTAGEAASKLTSKNINAISSDSDGNIWIATILGVYILNPQTFTVTHPVIRNSLPGKVKSQHAWCVFEDHKKRMWVGTDYGLHLYDRKANTFHSFLRQRTNARSLAADTVRTITEDQQGRLWVGTSNGLSQLTKDEQGFRNFRFDHKDPHTLSSNFIYALAVDQTETIWIGTEGGLDILDVPSGRVTRYAHDVRKPFSLHSKSARSLLIDPQGIHWVGTYEGGVSTYDRNLTLFDVERSNALDPFGLSAPLVTCFAENRNGSVYVGTDGGGLTLYHPQTRLFNRITIRSKKPTTLAGLPILDMLLDQQEQLWIGTFEHGLFVFDTRTGSYQQLLQGKSPLALNNNQVFCLKEDRAGNIWIGTNGGGINKYDPKNKVISKFTSVPQSTDEKPATGINDYIRTIEEDLDGNIWIGSYGTGIAVYHPGSQTFTAHNRANTGLPLERVTALTVDHLGNMWVGTGGEGLFVYSKQQQKFFAYAQREGLPNNVIHKVLEDDQGHIWVSTNRGISRLDTKRRRFINYSQFNGLQSNAFLNGSGMKSARGILFFGGAEGFNYINPSSAKVNWNVPPVILTGLSVDNVPVMAGTDSPLQQDIAVANEIHLNYKQDFSIGFTALNYTLPQQNQYAYRLRGFNEHWTYVGQATKAYYTNLDPGEYEFQVKASNNDGVWNTTGTHIKVIIRPPFWRTVYACILYIGLLGGILWYVRHRGIKKLHQQFAQEQERKEVERLRELDSLKIKFLTNLSHEFRTPISLILAPTDKLLTQLPDHPMAGQVQVIKRNAGRLLQLVNQLLDFRKMEEHELRLNLADGEITSFLQEATDSFRDLADAKKISLSLRTLPEELFVRFDHDKVERVLFNLLSNAFKFTPEGGKVEVELATLPPTPGSPETTVCIRVADTGIGLAPDKKARIFERFFQGHDVVSFLSQGSGIGLSITKEFVQMHGGTITVESEVGQGTTFTIVLPLATAKAPLASDNAEEIDAAAPIQNTEKLVKQAKQPEGGKLPHLLIVEDNEDFRFYLKDNLQEYYQVTDAPNGKEGWSKALSSHPDLIVSDVSMPYMDGLALSRKLKSDKRTNHIPVILLTALTREAEQLQGLASGANDYLTKPFNFEILNARIKNMLELNQSLKTTYCKQLKVVPGPVEVPSSNEKFLSKVVLFVEENLTSPNLSVEGLSTHFGMSRSSMYNRILELTGMTPVEFIRSFKLDRAAVLLLESNLTIAEIAYQTGFATPHYFTKSFKTKFNTLPSDYRNSKKERFGANSLLDKATID